jgi:N utilization substance protein A
MKNPTPAGENILYIVDAIHREKDIDREVLFQGIESALLVAARKKYAGHEGLEIRIDRQSGEVTAFEHGALLPNFDLGRIAAQTAKQVIIQKIREAESDVILKGYEDRAGQIITGNIHRFEGGALVVELGKAEGYMPKTEQIRGETYHIGDRIRAYVVEVKKAGAKVRIILSRAHPDFVRKMLELEVPEIAERLIEIKRLVREPGYRTKLAVACVDPRIDPVGACLGVRGSRIKHVIEELRGERVDIIPWDENPVTLVREALKPAQVRDIVFDRAEMRCLVKVDEDQLSLAIGRRGQNVRLAARLARVDISILTEDLSTNEARLEYEADHVDVGLLPEDDLDDLESGEAEPRESASGQAATGG